MLTNSPGRTGRRPLGWSPGPCGSWAVPADRSPSHSCRSWSCWRGSGAEEGDNEKSFFFFLNASVPPNLITWNWSSPSVGHVASSWSASSPWSSCSASWSVCGSSPLSLWSFLFPCPSLSPCRRSPLWLLCSPPQFQSPHHQSLHLPVHRPL